MSRRYISRWQQNSKIWVKDDFLYWPMITAKNPASWQDEHISQSHFLEVVKVCLWMLIKVHTTDLENLLSGELKEEHSGGSDAAIWLWLSQLGMTLRGSCGFLWVMSLMMTIFRVCTLWVIVLGGRSPQRGFAEINHAALQILTWMRALPGAYCECADELRESHPLLSGPVVAPVFGEPCSWCPCAPLDFWLSEQTAAGKRKRQVVCKILGEAEGNWEVNIKKL